MEDKYSLWLVLSAALLLFLHGNLVVSENTINTADLLPTVYQTFGK
jgi:hypothetical protein